MGTYEISDKVKGTEKALRRFRGEEGVIRRKIGVKEDFIAYDVEYKNKNINGHNADSKDGSGRCWWMLENQIKLINTETS